MKIYDNSHWSGSCMLALVCALVALMTLCGTVVAKDFGDDSFSPDRTAELAAFQNLKSDYPL